MKRRTFLKWQMGAAGLAVAGPALLSWPGQLLAQSSWPDIAVVKGPTAPAARAAVEQLGGMARFVKAGQKVVIKPNMSFARPPESGCNTSPELVRELVLMCQEAGASRIRVLDHTLHNSRETLEQSGILKACESVAPGICHHLEDESFYRETEFPDGREMRKNAVMRDVLEADVLIAAPVAKSHSGAGVSMSLKGQMGLLFDRRSMHSRYDLAEAIVDLNTLLKPHLVVMDASRVLSSGGPGGPGLILEPGEVIASTDPVAADALAVASYTWYDRKIEPRQVAHILKAHERGLGRMDIENLNIKRVTL